MRHIERRDLNVSERLGLKVSPPLIETDGETGFEGLSTVERDRGSMQHCATFKAILEEDSWLFTLVTCADVVPEHPLCQYLTTWISRKLHIVVLYCVPIQYHILILAGIWEGGSSRRKKVETAKRKAIVKINLTSLDRKQESFFFFFFIYHILKQKKQLHGSWTSNMSRSHGPTHRHVFS